MRGLGILSFQTLSLSSLGMRGNGWNSIRVFDNSSTDESDFLGSLVETPATPFPNSLIDSSMLYLMLGESRSEGRIEILPEICCMLEMIAAEASV